MSVATAAKASRYQGCLKYMTAGASERGAVTAVMAATATAVVPLSLAISVVYWGGERKVLIGSDSVLRQTARHLNSDARPSYRPGAADAGSARRLIRMNESK